MTDDLLDLFDPDRVAVVGATPREGSVGRAITRNLESYTGDVVAVNPNYDDVLGVPTVDTVEEAGDVDLAVVAVPAADAVEAVEDLGRHEVPHAVVVTAGFKEAGPDGAELQRQLTDAAETHGVDVVGPNCLGVLSTPRKLNATFSPADAAEGQVSFMSQSGALITAVLDYAGSHGMGFRHVVSLGNKAMLDETDFVEAWRTDDDTDVVAAYLEGVEDSRRFVEEARETVEDTPVVALKSGVTERGARAVSSHTGTMAGSERAYDAALRKAGAIRADSVQEMFDYTRAFHQPPPEFTGVAVVTNAGGPGVMAADATEDTDLELATLSEETRRRLEEMLPEAAAAENPVDVLGDADHSRFHEAAEIVADDPGVAALLVIACPTAVLSFDDLADTVEELQNHTELPLLTSFMTVDSEVERKLGNADTPNYFDPAAAVDSLQTLYRYREYRDRQYSEPPEYEVEHDRVEKVLAGDEHQLGVESMDLLEAYGIDTPESTVVDSPAAATEFARHLDGDVALKVVSPDIVHKTDVGCVEVGIGPEDAGEAYERVVANARYHSPEARLHGVQVQEMVDVDAGVETIVGVNRDSQFGHLLMFGVGGIYVEVYEDVEFELAPLTPEEARRMIDDVDASPLLKGARGRSEVDVDAVADVLLRISQLVRDHPEITELDINPLVALEDGAVAVDLRATVDHSQRKSEALEAAGDTVEAAGGGSL